MLETYLLPGMKKKSPQSHYFIVINTRSGITKKQFLMIFGQIIFSHDNTVGPKSISKGELIEKFELIAQEMI